MRLKGGNKLNLGYFFSAPSLPGCIPSHSGSISYQSTTISPIRQPPPPTPALTDSDKSISLKTLLNISFPFRHFLKNSIISYGIKCRRRRAEHIGLANGLDHLERAGGGLLPKKESDQRGIGKVFCSEHQSKTTFQEGVNGGS